MMHPQFYAIENELERRRKQAESVCGKDCNFRVEFRYRGGSRSYEYFVTKHDADNAADHMKCGYSVFGNPYTEHPTSRKTQQRGKRGGWSKAK